MNPVPARRSPVPLVLGALAMAGSVAVMGVLVFSDVADAKAPRRPEPVKVARVDPGQTVTAAEPSTEEALQAEPQIEQKPASKKRAKKSARVDFGRFEGY